MKSQARLRLRQAGKHRTYGTHQPVARWVRKFGIGDKLVMAFEMNCNPRHLRFDDWTSEMRQYPWCHDCGSWGNQHMSWCKHREKLTA